LKYDKGENDFMVFMNLIKKSGIILDIGANIGLMTVNLAKKFNDSTIYSFEPIPYNLEVLRRNTSFFNLNNVKIVDLALGNRDGKIEMVMPIIDEVKMQGLCHVVDCNMPKQSEGEKFSIDIKKLDDIDVLKNSEEPIIAIKIDVEHFEWAVFEGAMSILEKHKPIIYCELGENENRTKSFQLLKSLGYSTKVVINNSVIDYDPSKHNTLNFIFI
jgi:FkbM family methyltransferase